MINIIKENKIISLAVIGVVLGGIIGVVANSEQLSAGMIAGIGGVGGFLAGWVWNTRSGESDE